MLPVNLDGFSGTVVWNTCCRCKSKQHVRSLRHGSSQVLSKVWVLNLQTLFSSIEINLCWCIGGSGECCHKLILAYTTPWGASWDMVMSSHFPVQLHGLLLPEVSVVQWGRLVEDQHLADEHKAHSLTCFSEWANYVLELNLCKFKLWLSCWGLEPLLNEKLPVRWAD